jgi:Ca-activated chloride channel family protein
MKISSAAVLIDYDAVNCTFPQDQLLNTAKSALLLNFTEKDSFNLIFSRLNIVRASDTWLPADSATIEQTFAELQDHPISPYSNLPALLANGIDFVINNGNNSSIVLISSSDQVGDYKVANQLIDDLLALMDNKIPILIADYQNNDYSHYLVGGRYYLGNEYLYTNISRLTAGNYYNIRSGPYTLPELLATTLSSVHGFMSSFDLYTRLENGSCYGRYNLDEQRRTAYLNKPILQIGKYRGSFPFVIETSGLYESEYFAHKNTLDEQSVEQADSLAQEAWAGNTIQSLESQAQTNDVINEIVFYSLDERVLSIYSAFLCLEPSRGGEVCYNCMDESELVGVEDLFDSAQDDTLFTAYPNPFNNQVTIEISLPDLWNNEELSFRIYNMLGQVVRTFDPAENIEKDNYRFIWNGKNDSGQDVASGTFFFVVRAGAKQHTLKLVLMK